MLSLARKAPKRVSRPLLRSFAEIVHTPKEASSPSNSSLAVKGPTTSRSAFNQKGRSDTSAYSNRIPVREDHGLYAFFRRKEGKELQGDARFEVVESPDAARLPTGRAWTATELRLKSFKDLHTLWYVVLRERNLLATQKEEARRMGVSNPELQVSYDKVHQCRKTMARIKAVINERRLAYEGAVELSEQEVERYHNKKILHELKSQHRIATEARQTRMQTLLMQREEARRIAKETRRKATEEATIRNREKAEKLKALQLDREASTEQDLSPKETQNSEKVPKSKVPEAPEARSADAVPTVGDATTAGLFRSGKGV